VPSNDIKNNIFFNTEVVFELQCTRNKVFQVYWMLRGLDWYTRSNVLEEPVVFIFRIVQKDSFSATLWRKTGRYLLSIGTYINPNCSISQETLIFSTAIRSSWLAKREMPQTPRFIGNFSDTPVGQFAYTILLRCSRCLYEKYEYSTVRYD
jgi:hypothetical protein